VEPAGAAEALLSHAFHPAATIAESGGMCDGSPA